jgi:hypothetical protein
MLLVAEGSVRVTCKTVGPLLAGVGVVPPASVAWPVDGCVLAVVEDGTVEPPQAVRKKQSSSGKTTKQRFI